MRIGLLCTSTRQLVNAIERGPITGAFLSEIADPYVVLGKHYEVHLISPKGGPVPIDPLSREPQFLTGACREMPRQVLQSSIPVKHALLGRWHAILGAGGHGIIEDGPCEDVHRLYAQTWLGGGVIGAVCHGPWGLVGATVPGRGSLLTGVKVTCFSDLEESQDDHIRDYVPRPWLEEALRLCGAELVHEEEPWQSEVVVDDRIITGRNPQSGETWAHAVLGTLGGMESGAM